MTAKTPTASVDASWDYNFTPELLIHDLLNFWRMRSIQLQDLQETDTFFQTVKRVLWSHGEIGGEAGREAFTLCHFIDLSQSFSAVGV